MAIPLDINAAMMESTFALVGESANGGQVIGTGLVLGKPDAERAGWANLVLITADHVLSGMTTDTMKVIGRVLKEGSESEWEIIGTINQIRDSGRPLWLKHPDVDLAVMFVQLHERAIRRQILTSVLMTDERIDEFELGPGTELFCLGYPHGHQSGPGFPILRKGIIASYPILPTKEAKEFLFDFSVFPGNSGGPVYLYRVNPKYGNTIHLGSIQGIMGIVTSRRLTHTVVNQTVTTTSLNLAHVIPASYIIELIDQLPLRSPQIKVEFDNTADIRPADLP